jgi:alpha-L-rhamnosidase
MALSDPVTYEQSNGGQLMKTSGKLVFLYLTISVIGMANVQGVDFTLQNVVTNTISPGRFADLGSGHYFIEFPKAAFGTIDITITATASQSVTLKFGEKKIGDAVNTSPGEDVVYKSETLYVSSGTATYRIIQHPTLLSGYQPDKLFATIPFRYVEVSNCPGAFTASNIKQITVNYPFNENASGFTSSNSTLNAVWDLCKYTMKACSWLGIYVDGNRERHPYEADAYIEQLGHYCQDTQSYGIARNTFTYLLSNPSWPAEWKFHSIYAAWAEYMWTGDTSFLSANYSTLKTKTLESYARSDGLINTPGNGGELADNAEIVDWPYQWRDGYVFGNYARHQCAILSGSCADGKDRHGSGENKRCHNLCKQGKHRV